MFLSHRIALDPTDAQRRYFAKAAGCDRFCWNLAVDEWNRSYAETGKTPSWIEMVREFNEFKYDAFPWLSELHRDAHTNAFERLGEAWKRHFKNPKQTGRPTFHKKGRMDSFYVASDNTVGKIPRLRTSGCRIRLHRIGWVRMREELRFSGKIKGATVFLIANRWYVNIQVEVSDEKSKKRRTAEGVIGVDVGINAAVTLGTGEKIEGPKPLKKELRKLRRMQRRQRRQQLGGKNRAKTNKRLARIYARIANIRKDFWHKVTTRLCRENQAIGIETLNVEGMKHNRSLAQALEDAAIGKMRPMLEYKSKIYDCVLHKTGMFYASSKTCSVCGAKKESLSLKERVFHCDSCGAVMDRDVNAAKNEENELKKFLVCAKTIPEAFGESE